MIELCGVSQTFLSGTKPVEIFNQVNMSFAEGKKTAILGKSGSGKSTLLHLIAGLLKPSHGVIRMGDVNLTDLTEEKMSQFRAQHMGIIFQAFHLIPTFTALENVLLPLEINGQKNSQRAQALLKNVGLGERFDHYPSQLSGGEQQRVAMARALVHDPTCLLADEPSGNLDEATGEAVMNLLFDMVNAQKKTLILVTHDPELARRCDETWVLSDKQFSKK